MHRCGGNLFYAKRFLFDGKSPAITCKLNIIADMSQCQVVLTNNYFVDKLWWSNQVMFWGLLHWGFPTFALCMKTFHQCHPALIPSEFHEVLQRKPLKTVGWQNFLSTAFYWTEGMKLFSMSFGLKTLKLGEMELKSKWW